MGLPGWAGTRKVKPIWILLKQETVSGSGISWTICKSAPSFRQTASHHSVFYRSDALPAAQPTASKHWRHVNWDYICSSSKFRAFLAVSVSNALVMLCWLQVVTCRRTLTQPRWRSWINRWWRWWIHEYCSRWVTDLIALCITAVSNKLLHKLTYYSTVFTTTTTTTTTTAV